MIEGQQQLCVQFVFPEDTQEVLSLLSFLNQGPDVVGPGVVCGDVGAQKPEGGDNGDTIATVPSPRPCMLSRPRLG